MHLGSLRIPLNAATKTFAILAKRGAGKSYTGAVMAEEFHKYNIPFVVFDPIDVWWGLRLNKNGKDTGLPVAVFGLEHADIALNVQNALRADSGNVRGVLRDQLVVRLRRRCRV